MRTKHHRTFSEGVRYKTAADFARAFAELTGCSEDESLRRLFVAPRARRINGVILHLWPS